MSDFLPDGGAGAASVHGLGIRQPLHERLTAPQLLQGHELVGLVGLLDAAGAAHHGGDARVLEQPGFGTEGHQRGASFAAQPLSRWARRVTASSLLPRKLGISQMVSKPKPASGATFFIAGSSDLA